MLISHTCEIWVDIYGRIIKHGEPGEKFKSIFKGQFVGRHIRLWLPENKRMVGETFYIEGVPKPHEVKEQKQWERWSVLVVSYGSDFQKYYYVKTGFLVGEYNEGEITMLVDTNIDAVAL